MMLMMLWSRLRNNFELSSLSLVLKVTATKIVQGIDQMLYRSNEVIC